MRHARMFLRIQPRPQPDRWQPGKLLVTCPPGMFVDYESAAHCSGLTLKGGPTDPFPGRELNAVYLTDAAIFKAMRLN
ncbi:hypothetical protein [Burkholderia phage BCSR52]|uniref:Uncharacterized protein n=1 Tax=Burkholderia phage BCSR52 TaxID=2805748 RepID=A0A889IQH9_9CAUD|nr:hypothetical protein [Burkholderia phage BCSR52]